MQWKGEKEEKRQKETKRHQIRMADLEDIAMEKAKSIKSYKSKKRGGSGVWKAGSRGGKKECARFAKEPSRLDRSSATSASSTLGLPEEHFRL